MAQAPENAALRRREAMALLDEGIALGRLQDPEGFVVSERAHWPDGRIESTLDELAEEDEEAADIEPQRYEAAIKVFDEILVRFGEADQPTLREPVAKALLYKGRALIELRRYQAAIGAQKELVRHFGEAGEPILREQAAHAVLDQSAALIALGQVKEAIDALRELVRRCANETEPSVRRLADWGQSLAEGFRRMVG